VARAVNGLAGELEGHRLARLAGLVVADAEFLE